MFKKIDEIISLIFAYNIRKTSLIYYLINEGALHNSSAISLISDFVLNTKKVMF